MLSAVILNWRSYPALLLLQQPVHQRSTLPGPLVLRLGPLNFHSSTVDRDQTVSRRSKPNSRTTLFGEQTNPWNLLQLQDVMSRHRGAKQLHRYELLRVISLLSPAYLLSVERWPFHNEPPDHYNRLASLFDMSVLQSGKHMLLRSTADYFPAWAYLCAPPLLFGRRPPQPNYQPFTVSLILWNKRLVSGSKKSGISRTPQQLACAKVSKAPTYPAWRSPTYNEKM